MPHPPATHDNTSLEIKNDIQNRQKQKLKISGFADGSLVTMRMSAVIFDCNDLQLRVIYIFHIPSSASSLSLSPSIQVRRRASGGQALDTPY